MDIQELKSRIKTVLDTQPNRDFKTKELAKRLQISHQRYNVFRQTLKDMAKSGEILGLRKNRFRSAGAGYDVVGELRVNSQGYGFVLRENEHDVFISKKNMGMALHKDIVRVRMYGSSRQDHPEGQVLEIVERGHNQFVGTYHSGNKYGYVIPDDIKVQIDLIIPYGNENGAQEGHKVVAEIEEWTHHGMNPSGRIVQVLGFPDDPGVDVLSIIHGFEIGTDFSETVEKEAKKKSVDITAQEQKYRLDLRQETVFTIDPEDAKDFDDAISLKINDKGNWLLGVHIADVSHYVDEGAPVDLEALKRGTSVYLVDRVIPMLPEYLSNNLCSLVKGEDRFTFSVVVELSPEAKVLSYDIQPSIIHSAMRFNYEQVQNILDGKDKHELSDTLKKMDTLAKQLGKRRASIDLDTPEVKIILDDKGIPVEIIPRKRFDSHRLVEEFMLLANRVVARHVGKTLSPNEENPTPFVYRIHEKPEHQSVVELVQLAHAFGFEINVPKKITPTFYKDLAKRFKEHAAATVLQDALVRSMTKAKYSTMNAGHFGLSFGFYSHFTSPIRRYPDLMVHRLLKRYAKDPKNWPDIKALEKICQQNSSSEVKAMDAERASVKIKQVEYLEQHIGDCFEGFISRLVNFGIFVRLPQFLVDGLVHIRDLDDDYYIFDEKKYEFRGEHRGKIYRLGETVRVCITRVSRDERLIDFTLAE